MIIIVNKGIHMHKGKICTRSAPRIRLANKCEFTSAQNNGRDGSRDLTPHKIVMQTNPHRKYAVIGTRIRLNS